MMVAKSYVREGFTMRGLMTAFALASALTLMTSMGTLAATFVPISSPDAAYLAATNYIDPSAKDGSFVASISDGTQTVHFKTPDGSAPYGVQKFTAPGDDWGTWSQAPDSQRGAGDTLPVFYSNGATVLRFGLATPVNIFGFEAQPHPLATYTMVAKFYDAEDNLLGTISRDVDGYAGALLFAAQSDVPIAYVVFSSDVDWAVGAFRYGNLGGPSPVIPEPGTMLLMGIGGLAIGLGRRFGRK
jgi:hypothetical protein